MFWKPNQQLGTEWAAEAGAALMAPDQSEATEIFLERARREKGCTWRPSSTELYQIGRIIRATQGLPLALELAAAWICRVPLSEIADGLQEMRTPGGPGAFVGTRIPEPTQPGDPLSRCLEWCFDRLEPWAREGFARVGVFAGSFSPESATSICFLGDPVSVLFRLRDASLIQQCKVRGGIRYALPPGIRPCALSKFERIYAADKIRERFIRHFCQLTEEKQALAEGRADAPSDQGLAWFSDEWPNLFWAAETAFALKDYRSCWTIASRCCQACPPNSLNLARLHKLARVAQQHLN